MKKYIVYIIIGFIVVGCKKQLELTPLGAISTANFFQSQSDFDLALNGLYDKLQDHDQGGLGGVFAGGLYWEVASDGLYFQFSWHTPWYDISDGNIAPTSDNVSFLWDQGYSAIGWSNTILSKLTNASLDEDYKKDVDGEVHFIRAITYLRLVSIYGDVPLVLNRISISDAQMPRTSKDSIFKLIISDLNVASDELTVTPYNGQMGRATKQAALGMEVRAWTYYASPLFNPKNDMSRWDSAKSSAMQLMNLAAQNISKIGLLSNYADIFSTSNKDNKEILFNIEYTANNSQEGGNNELPFGPSMLPTQGGVASGWGASAIVPEYADSYIMADGLPSNKSPLYSASNPWANRDSRFYSTFFVAGITKLSDGSTFSPLFLNSYVGPTYRKDYPLSVRKGIDPSADNQAYDNEQNCNDIILRYADVLLMYAEAENELVGPDASVYSVLHQIRQRVGMPDIPSGLNQEEMRKAIQNERKWEFGYEGVRYFDIRRWMIADSVMNGLTKGNSYNIAPAKKFNAPQNYWWPIAIGTIDSDPKIVQNPGY